MRVDLNTARSENNFKLLCGTGTISTDQPVVDELFALKVNNALRLRRTVQIIDSVEVFGEGRNEGCSLKEEKEKSLGNELQWTNISEKNHPGFDTEVHVTESA